MFAVRQPRPQGVGEMQRNGARVLGPLTVAVVVIAAWPAAASAAGWRCEASALRAQVLTAPPVEPAPANRGAAGCTAATGGGETTPALPVGLFASVLGAQTGLDGPIAGPAAAQVARAEAGAGDVRFAALPALPLPLPDPDFGNLDALRVPGIGTVDLQPALEALIQPRTLPGIDLLAVRAARAEATARCVDGVPRFGGSSSLAALAVNGRELGLDRATTETVRLIDSQSLDPSDVDVGRVVAPPGVDVSVLQAALRPLLDRLPDVTVPATVARVRLVPNERLQSGTRLTQRALHAELTVAGRLLADIVVGEATVGVGDVRCGGVADLALECGNRPLVLIDVYEQGGHVRLLGAAHRRFVGRRVRIRSLATGRTVARPRVRRDGTFRATAALPPAAVRDTNRARYVASIRRERSMRLKLHRRMLVTSMRSRRRTVTIAGRVVQPLADPVQTVVVKRRLSCGRWRVVKRFRPPASGRFHVRLPAPRDGEAAVYRMSTRVRLYPWLAKTYPTFTLPRYVDLG
jgi:hypothetical protein